MADLSITAANVVAAADSKSKTGLWGEAVTAGQPVVRDPATRKFLKQDVDSATVALRGCDGIALNSGALNQPAIVHIEGGINIGAALTVGTIYVSSDAPGGIMPAADLESGDFVTVLGVATSVSNLMVKPIVSGVAVP